MVKLISRILLSVPFAIVLAITGIIGNAVVLQTLFTVLGIVFSISMSLLVSFNLSKILNQDMRKNFRYTITHVQNMLLLDFGVATLVLAVALIWDEKHLRYTFMDWLVIDIMLIAVVQVFSSLIYEIYNFHQLHKLHTDIEDAVIAEEIEKANRLINSGLEPKGSE